MSNTQTTNNTKTNKNIPELRFPGFEGEWVEKRLGEVSSISSGGTPLRSKKEYWNGHIPWVTTSLINFNEIYDTDEYITKLAVQKSSAKLYQKGTILIAMYGQGKTRGKVAILGLDSTTNQACGIIRVDIDKLYNIFIFHNLAGRYIEIRNMSNEGGQKNLSGSLLKKIKVAYPTVIEQNKIASFLSVVDTKIDLLNIKKELMEQYKKGIMQKIFSQEIRFKDDDGNDYPDWEEVTLGVVSDESMYGMNSAAIEYDGTHKYIRITDIDEFSRLYNPSPVVSPSGDINKKFKVESNDLLFARTGASVGKSYLYNTKDGDLYFAGFLIKFRLKSTCNAEFIFHQTFGEKYNNWVKVMSRRTGQPGINLEEYKTLKISLPDIEEQNKITNLLSSMVKKILVIDKELKAVNKYKKGLLQKMYI